METHAARHSCARSRAARKYQSDAQRFRRPIRGAPIFRARRFGKMGRSISGSEEMPVRTLRNGGTTSVSSHILRTGRSPSLHVTKKLEPQTGTAFELKKGQTLRIIDLEGEQVADLIAFARDDKSEWLSSGRSIDYA